MLKLGLRLRKDSQRIHIQGLDSNFKYNNNAHLIYFQIVNGKSYIGKQSSISADFMSSMNLTSYRGAKIQ